MPTGETEWAKSGRYTGTTDIGLTPEGISQVSSAATTLVGAGKLVDPSQLAHAFVSPRTRAKRTFQLLLSCSDTVEWAERVTYTEDIAEWDYGDYEGLKVGEIRDLRKARGLDRDRKWDIWRDGCEGGEYAELSVLPLSSLLVVRGLATNSCIHRSMQQISERLDRLILQIREIHRPRMNGGKPSDVLLVRLRLHHPFRSFSPIQLTRFAYSN